MLTKKNAILFCFLLIAIFYLVWILFSTMQNKFCKTNVAEHFTEYESRMNVMKVFESVMNRKPTQEEIDKYFVIENEQDMLIAVMADNNITQEHINEEYLNVGEELVYEEEKMPTMPSIEPTIQPVSMQTQIASPNDNSIQSIEQVKQEKDSKIEELKIQLVNNKRDMEIDNKLKDIISTVADIRMIISLKNDVKK